MSDAPTLPGQFNIRALLGVMTLSALVLAAYRFFGWPVLVFLFHPAALFVYVGIFLEWRNRQRLIGLEKSAAARQV